MHQQNRTHHKARCEKGQLNNLGNKINTTYALTIAKHDTNQQNPPLKTKTNYPRQNSHWNNFYKFKNLYKPYGSSDPYGLYGSADPYKPY